jgi:hypothetical protein
MRNPFVGLRPFQSVDSAVFFGRTRDIAILKDLILTLPVLVLYAASGTGKSSLLNAGLLPVIDQDPTLLPIVLADPHENVVQTVQRKLASTGWVDDAQPDNGELADMLERYFSSTERRVILVLDQFEERLKQLTTIEVLYAEIARLANTRSHAATVVISIREDYLGGLEKLMRRVSGLLDASYRVPNLSRSALAQAVHGPLKAVGSDVTVDDSLIEEVLTDLERQTDPSESLDGRMLDSRMLDSRIEAGYFQIVWSHLWEKDATKPGSRLTRDTYEHEGGATGILKSFVSDTLSQLVPFEAEVLQAAIRYMVLPTAAKVALTIDDILGLLRANDFTGAGRQLLLSADDDDDPDGEGQQLSIDDQQTIGRILESVFRQLTRTDTPLFRRVIRSGRVEFELIHDLLGLILLQWRLQYESAQSKTTYEVLSDVGGGRGRYESRSQTPRMTEKSAQHRLHSAREFLILYGRNLKAAETVDEAEKNGQILRSAHVEIGAVAAARSGTAKSNEELERTLQAVWHELHVATLNHHSREIRRIAQQQAYEFLAMRGLISRYPYYVSQESTVGNIVTWVVGLVLAIVGIYTAQWLIRQGWHVPDVQYMPLTLSVVAVSAAILYTVVYDDQAKIVQLEWTAVRNTLWPSWPESGSTIYSRDEGSEVPSVSSSWWRRAGKLTVIFMWWPIHYLVFGVACFAGAALFQLAGWSPTAGFNLIALISAIVLGALYLVAVDY